MRLRLKPPLMLLVAFGGTGPALASDAEDCLVAEKAEQVIELCTKAIESGPSEGEIQPSELYFARGVAYVETDRFEKAEADLTKSIELNPDEANAYAQRCVANNRLGKVESAISDCTKALEMDPEHLDGRYNRALAYHAIKEDARALDDLDKTVATGMRGAQALATRGDVHVSLGDLDKALADYEAAAGIDPDDAAIHHSRAIALAKKTDYAMAIESLSKAIAIEPANADYLQARGEIYAVTNAERAIEDFAKVIELKPDSLRGYVNRADLLIKSGRLKEAAKDVDRALALAPDVAEAVNMQGRLLEALGRKKAAIAAYRKAMTSKPFIDGSTVARDDSTAALARLGTKP